MPSPDWRKQRSKLRVRPAPLLLSVRSGAKFSMPGMMDTVLNLGINDEVVEAADRRGPATHTSPGTPIADSSRCTERWSSVFPSTSSRRSSPSSETVAGVEDDSELTAEDLERPRGGSSEIVEQAAPR